MDEVKPEDNEIAEIAAPKKKSNKSVEPASQIKPAASCSAEIAAPKKKSKKSAEAEIDEGQLEDDEQRGAENNAQEFPIARFRRCRIDVYKSRSTVGLYCKEIKRQAFSMFFVL